MDPIHRRARVPTLGSGRAGVVLASLMASLLGTLLIQLISAPHVHAANLTFTTTTTTDAARAPGPARSTCDSTLGVGICTLRAAIEEAVLPAHAADVITINVANLGGVTTYPLTLGLLPAISTNLTFVGPGAGTVAIDGLSAVRVLTIVPAVTVSITGLTITHGNAVIGAGVSNSGTLTLTGVTLTDNTAGAGGGGGIQNTGTLTLTNSNVNGNHSSGGTGAGIQHAAGTLTINGGSVSSNNATGGLAPFGAGIYGQAPMTLNNTLVSLNSNPFASGGGIFNFGSTLTLNNTTVTGNTATTAAGISNGGTANITDSTISQNVGDASGIQSSGTLNITRSTISGNTSPGAFGGGIDMVGTATLINVTLSGNSAPSGAALDVANVDTTVTMTNVTIANNTSTLLPGAITNFGATLTLLNTIVANNPGGNCRDPIPSATFSLDSGTSCGFAGSGSLSNTNPLLGPLASNGGPTQTHALLAGSPAIDAGTNAGCPTTDQRGVTRPQGPRCDIGAYEFAVAPSLPNTGRSAEGSAELLALAALLATTLLSVGLRRARRRSEPPA